MMAMMGSKAIAVTEHENKFPECLKLEISGEVVAAKSEGPWPFSGKSEPEAIALFVRINFNEQWINEQWGNFSFGRVKFGLRGGELRLKLENGKMPSESRSEALKKFAESKVIVDRQVAREDENKSQVEGSLTVGSSKAGIKGGGESRRKYAILDKFQVEIAQISHKGEDNEPVWVFENQTGETVWIKELAGSLGEMLIEGIPLIVEATFTREMPQVIVTGLEDLFNGDIFGSNKLKALDLGVAKLFLKHKTQPYLSRQVLRYE